MGSTTLTRVYGCLESSCVDIWLCLLVYATCFRLRWFCRHCVASPVVALSSATLYSTSYTTLLFLESLDSSCFVTIVEFLFPCFPQFLEHLGNALATCWSPLCIALHESVVQRSGGLFPLIGMYSQKAVLIKKTTHRLCEKEK